MRKISKEQQFEAVKGWWNSEQVNKWDKQYDDWDPHTVRSLNRRLEKILIFVDELKFANGSKVLELGYGAGQTALKMGQRGLEVHGIDLSNNLRAIANERCRNECPNGKFFLKTGNIESKFDYKDNTFDLVIVSGVFHYLYNHDYCASEIHRVLKSGGHLIIGQRTSYSLNISSVRTFFRSCIYFIFREKYELFPSYKSMLCDSKLGYFFDKYRDTKFFNSKFMLKGHDKWKYKLKKNLYSNGRLKSLCKRNGISPIKLTGAYYAISENPKYYNLNLKIDEFFEKLTNFFLFRFLFRLSRITVLLGKKQY